MEFVNFGKFHHYIKKIIKELSIMLKVIRNASFDGEYTKSSHCVKKIKPRFIFIIIPIR